MCIFKLQNILCGGIYVQRLIVNWNEQSFTVKYEKSGPNNLQETAMENGLDMDSGMIEEICMS